MKTISQATPLLLCAVMLFCLCVPVVAQNEGIKEQMPESNIAPCATGRFSMAVSATKLSLANSSFALQQDEIVTINASNTPITASVDFGLVDENGTFFYLSGADGQINRSMIISEAGNYTFAIRNNSSYAISVAGTISY